MGAIQTATLDAQAAPAADGADRSIASTGWRMELLETAVVDVTLLMATSRALRARRGDGPAPLRGRRRIRDELRRGAVAYLRTLLRGEQQMPGAALLAASRVAAEGKMPRSIAAADGLRAMMASQPGALAGFASTRHDLWRLAHMAIHLRHGASNLAVQATDADTRELHKTSRRLGKRLRKSLVAYVRTCMRVDGENVDVLGAARRAAVGELGAWSATDAATLAHRESDLGVRRHEIEIGVSRALSDLLTDWAGAGLAQPAQA
jgi:hypothetical protein